MDKSSFLAEASKIIAELKEVDVAYIFGSFLEGEEFNDIDVLLFLSDKVNLDSYKSLNFASYCN